MSSHEIVLSLLLQLVVILGVSRFMGILFARLSQPRVVGEMVAGIVLGPSLFGLLLPGAAAVVFPPQTLPYLNTLSQFGVILFLFLVGLELDPKLLRNKGEAAVLISHVSIIAPFLLGAGAAIYLYPRLFNHTPMMRFTAVALFMGAAMSITAFPVLARILTERNLHKTTVGAITITCAAVDDITAWCMLAFVVAVSRATGLYPALQTAGLSIAYVILMLAVVRPLLKRLDLYVQRRGGFNQNVIAIIFLLLLASALTTQAIGIHALFGAFLMGAIMPKRSEFTQGLTARMEDITVTLLLPIFFAYAGLKTRIGLLSSAEMIWDTALIIFIACVGKFGGSTIAGRICGLQWREASAIGILMNTRGLMELVILTIGREMGVITDAVFTMMVLMALVTTAMTTPLLQIFYPDRLFSLQPSLAPSSATGPSYNLLVPIARREHGRGLLRIAQAIAGATSRLHALHLLPGANHDAFRSAAEGSQAVRDEMLDAVIQEAKQPDVVIEPISLVSLDAARDIIEVAENRRADLILMGSHEPVIGRTILGGVVHQVLADARTDVAIFLNRGFENLTRVIVPYMGSPHDRLALETARRLAQNVRANVTVLHVIPPSRREESAMGAQRAMDKVFADPAQPTPVTFRVVEDASRVDAVIRESASADLIVIGMTEEWGLESHLVGWRQERIAAESRCSLLMVHRGSEDAAMARSSSN